MIAQRCRNEVVTNFLTDKSFVTSAIVDDIREDDERTNVGRFPGPVPGPVR